MSRVALPAMIALAAYSTSFVPPDPGLTRIAPARAMPRQRSLAEGFWGASADLQLIGPDLEVLYGRRPASVPYGDPITVVFNAVLDSDRPDLVREAKDLARRGFLRMEPGLWYGVRADCPDGFVPDGRSACTGRFFWRSLRRPVVAKGWRIVSRRTFRIDLNIFYPNPAAGGGGVGVALHEPEGWRLRDIGLSCDERYVVGFQPAVDSPYSTWKGPKPTALKDIIGPYRMEPRVLAEVVEAVLVDETSGKSRVTRTPTGWVEAAGRFSRIDGSG